MGAYKVSKQPIQTITRKDANAYRDTLAGRMSANSVVRYKNTLNADYQKFKFMSQRGNSDVKKLFVGNGGILQDCFSMKMTCRQITFSRNDGLLFSSGRRLFGAV